MTILPFAKASRPWLSRKGRANSPDGGRPFFWELWPPPTRRRAVFLKRSILLQKPPSLLRLPARKNSLQPTRDYWSDTGQEKLSATPPRRNKQLKQGSVCVHTVQFLDTKH